MPCKVQHRTRLPQFSSFHRLNSSLPPPRSSSLPPLLLPSTPLPQSLSAPPPQWHSAPLLPPNFVNVLCYYLFYVCLQTAILALCKQHPFKIILVFYHWTIIKNTGSSHAHHNLKPPCCHLGCGFKPENSDYLRPETALLWQLGLLTAGAYICLHLMIVSYQPLLDNIGWKQFL